MEFTAKQLAQILKGTVDGDESAKVTSFAKIEHGKPGQLCFYANPKYEQFVYSCKASVLLVNKDFEPKETVNVTMVRVDNAYTALAALLKYVASSKRTDRRHRGFRSSWFLTTKFGRKVYLGSHSYVGHHASVGDFTKIFENVYIGDDTHIGKHCIIYPGVVIYPGMIIGDNVIIHANAVIGSDGFGNAPQADGTWEKIEHLGNVIIGDNVEIGAGTTIDRAEMDRTGRYRRFHQDRKKLHHRRTGRHRRSPGDCGQYHAGCTGGCDRQCPEKRTGAAGLPDASHQDVPSQLRQIQAGRRGIIFIFRILLLSLQTIRCVGWFRLIV